MKTIEMETALMRHLDFRTNLIVPNISWGAFICGRYLHECDLLLITKSGFATEIEIKVNRTDLLKDKNKGHNHSHPAISKLYFAVPEKLIDLALAEIPERAGLFVVNKTKSGYFHVKMIRAPKPDKKRYRWNLEQRYQIARLGAIRVYGLKKKLIRK